MIVTVPATVAQDQRSTWADGNAVASAVEDEQCSVLRTERDRGRGRDRVRSEGKKKGMVKKLGEAGIEVKSWVESEGRSKVRQTRPTSSFWVKTPGQVQDSVRMLRRLQGNSCRSLKVSSGERLRRKWPTLDQNQAENAVKKDPRGPKGDNRKG